MAETKNHFGPYALLPPPAQIVLIDDDLVMAAMLSMYLGGEGMMVMHAVTGADGLRLASKPGTCVVLLDVVLPDKSGFEILRELGSQSGVPVIMLTMPSTRSASAPCAPTRMQTIQS